MTARNMITVIHAFPEEDIADQEAHLRYWYGTVQPEAERFEDPATPVVCWCGARHIRMSDHSVAVWHTRCWTNNG